MNFLQLKQRLAVRTNRTSGTLVTDTNTRFGQAINERHRELLRMPGMERVRWANVTFATVASQQGYALPLQGVARINRIYNTTDRIKLKYRDLAWLREVDPNPSTGLAEYWIPTGTVQVHTQPANASEVFVKSTAAGTPTAYVEGIITGGYYRTANVAMTGTTAVSLSTSITNWIAITKFYLSAATTGIVTLHEDSGTGTELSRIAIDDVYGAFLSYVLYPTPSAAVTLNVDITRAIADMSNDTDEPLIDEDFHDILIDGAELREMKKSDDPVRYGMVREQWEVGKKQWKFWVQDHPDWRPVMTGGYPQTRVEQSWTVT